MNHQVSPRLTVLFNVLDDAPDQQGDLMSWLPAVLHLLQGDPEHSGRAKGVAEGSIEALPHRLHSLAASVRLHTEMPRTRSRYQGWGASSDDKLQTTRTKQDEN